MAIKTSIPYRIGLIGGGTDLPFFTNKFGSEILNASFKAFSHCEIQKIQSPHIFIETQDYQKQIQIDKLPEVALLSQDEFRITLAVLNHFSEQLMSTGVGLHIKTYSDFSPQTGLGGSSAHLISVLKSLLTFIQAPWTDQQIIELSHSLERNTLSIFGGFQDFYPCLYQGAHYLAKTPTSEIQHKKLDSSFLKRLDLTFYVMETRSPVFEENDLPDSSSLQKQKQLAGDAVKSWAANDPDKFKKLLKESWHLKHRNEAALPFVYAAKSCGLSKKMKVLAVENSMEKSFEESVTDAVRKIEWH